MNDDLQRLSQGVRLADVFIIGPIMIWGGAKAPSMPKGARAFLMMAGLATIMYNGFNFISFARGK